MPTKTVIEVARVGAKWRLNVRTPLLPSGRPAGPRLFRSPPVPAIAFEHDTEAGALTDAAKLNRYLDTVANSRPKRP